MVVLHALAGHLHALFDDAARPRWDGLLVLTRTAPGLHDLALLALHRALGTRAPTRRTWRPNAPLLSTALPKDVRRKLRFIRRLCAADPDRARGQKIKSLSKFCVENRDANSELAKAYVVYYAALAMIHHRAFRDAVRALQESLRFCAMVRPLELAELLHSVVSRRLEELRVALQLDAIAHKLFKSFILPHDQAVPALTRCLDMLERCRDLRTWQLNVGGLPRLLTMMRDNDEYAPAVALRHRAGALLLKWQRREP